MNQDSKWLRFAVKSMSYVLVAAAASVLTLLIWGVKNTKLLELERIIDQKFVGQVDMDQLRDVAAEAMVDAVPDRWSYYISAEEYTAFQERKDNAYVGIGVTIQKTEDGTGYHILEVSPGGSAKEAGILPGDILVEVQGISAAELDVDQLSEQVRGKKGTKVSLVVLRDGEEISFNVRRREIRLVVTTGQMLEGNVGLITIANFNDGCAEETIDAIETLIAQGAQKLIFDVRNNPGGYISEMIEVLDYLLPEGVIYRSVDYRGNEEIEKSDADCIELPMAVLVNADTYSAAEFFAAALSEFEWATLAGEPTTGKGHYQNTFVLSDGSAINISTGKYFTPNGVSLTEVGGLQPDVLEEVDEETAARIYSDVLEPAEDPQIQAAIAALIEK